MSQAARVVESAELMSPLQLQLRQAIRLHDDALAAETEHQSSEVSPVERLLEALRSDLAAHQRKRDAILDRVSKAPENEPSKRDLESINELDAAIKLTESRLAGARTRHSVVNTQQINIAQRRQTAAKSRDALAEACAYQDFVEHKRGEQLELQRRLVAVEHEIAGARMSIMNSGSTAADPAVTSHAFNELSSFLTWEVPAIALVKQEDGERYRRYLEAKKSDPLATYR